MDSMDMQAFWTLFMALCAGIVAIGGAGSVLERWHNRARKPLDENMEKISEHDRYLSSDKRRIENLEIRQAEIDEQNKLMLKALFTLLGHEIDGNHVDQLEKVRGEINEYLINK